MNTGTISSQSLRDDMVDRIAADHEGKGLVLRPDIDAALRKVPRELYTPGTPAEDAYAFDQAVITKRHGTQTLSSVSAAYLIAEMLGQAADALGSLAGCDVLEIGSGGYNASLLRELTGPAGSVTTVDIDPDVTGRAAACLEAAGYSSVTVICADAEQPVQPGRRYDLIIVTAGAWDIPPAWRDQLTDGGVLVVPLRTHGMTRSWALRRSGGHLVSHSHRLCGFVPFQGGGASEIRYLDIADGVYLRLDEGQQFDSTAVSGLLTGPRKEAWTGVSLPPRTVLADLDLWLAIQPPGQGEQFAVLTADAAAVESGTVAPSWQFGTPAVLGEDGTLCYRSQLRWTDRMFDVGAYAHGPQAAAAASRMAGQMRAWTDACSPAPQLRAYPADTPGTDLPAGAVLDKRHSRLVLSFTPEDEKGTL